MLCNLVQQGEAWVGFSLI